MQYERGTEFFIEHLKLIQNRIFHFAILSFIAKIISSVMATAFIVLLAVADISFLQTLVLLIVPIGLCVFDGFYLWQERLYRSLYDSVRARDTADFCMSATAPTSNLYITWAASTFSKTLLLFYGIQIVLILLFSLL